MTHAIESERKRNNMAGNMRLFSIPQSVTSSKMAEAAAAAAAEETEFKKMRFEPIARDVELEDALITDVELKRAKQLANITNPSRKEELELIMFQILMSRRITVEDIVDEVLETHQSFQSTNELETLFNEAAEIIQQRNIVVNNLKKGETETVQMRGFRRAFDRIVTTILELPDPEQTPQPKQQQQLQPRNLFGGGQTAPDAFLIRLMDEMSTMVREGMSPVYTFLGMVATRLGMNSASTLYRYNGKGESLQSRQDPVVKTATNVDDFIVTNRHLGRPLIELFLMAALKKKNLLGADGKDVDDTFAEHWKKHRIQPTLVGALIDQSDQDFVRAYLDTALPANAIAYGAQWVYGALDFEAVKYVVDNTCWGAINVALSQVRRIPNCARFELKQLMLSGGVSDQFAFLCASSFMVGSGGNASAGRINVNNNGKVQGTTYNLSAGFQTRTNLAAQIECCHYWFERVFEQANPALVELQRDLDDYDRAHGAALGPTYLGRSEADFLRMSAALGAVGGAVGAQQFASHQLRIVKVEKLRIARQMLQKTLIHYE